MGSDSDDNGFEPGESLELPVSFGKQIKKQSTGQGLVSQHRIAETQRPQESEHLRAHSGEHNGDNDEIEGTDSYDLPVSHEFILKSHTRPITALVCDPSGARLASGSQDFQLKLWDFGGMDSSAKPFRSIEPEESHQVSDLAWSPRGDLLLVAPGGSRAKIYDRDGSEVGEYAKGDPYLRDLKLTAGHTGEITSVNWHPTDPDTFVTSSQDGTIRFWSMSNRSKCKTTIVVKSKDRGGRTKVTVCAISHNGKWIAACTTDGSLHVWQVGSHYIKPNYSCEGKAHVRDTETTGLIFAKDNVTLFSRGSDDTVKKWKVDTVRSGAIATTEGIPHPGSHANVILSPDEKYVLTGTTGLQGTGSIVVLDAANLSVLKMVNVGTSSITKILWPPKIDQIITGAMNGSLHVLYSPTRSRNGALLAVVKVSKRSKATNDEDSSVLPPDAQILLPNALPAFADANPTSEKRRMEKLRKDPIKSHRPELPIMTGPGKGGRIGASATQHLVRTLVKDKMSDWDEDPREALLKYQNKDGQDAEWTKAYKETQPTPIFRKDPKEIEKEEELKRKKARLW